jgi:hypothetical protein
MENAIFVYGEEDGRFDESDYILFYGEGPVAVSIILFSRNLSMRLIFILKRPFIF